MSLVEVFMDLCMLVAIASILLGLIVLIIVAWKKKWKRVKWGASILLVGLLVFGHLYDTDQIFRGEFPFQRERPIEADIPGTYVLLPERANSLKAQGYTNVSAQIILRKDKTFEIRDMPHLWLYSSSFRDGYDTCSGTWEIEVPIGSKTYSVVPQIEHFSETSAINQEKDKEYSLAGVILDIADKTKVRPDYALAVPLNWGDEGYLIFVKQKADDASGAKADP
ncbi:MAG TPA: hypothetical protein VH255_08395 [Verrucomicrobiae bacterium]|jgi:hypothetical protein|nr:hypothetical protein [Verrucomicrobiae bacterium]